MGGRRRSVALLRECGFKVSNPLGWEGDQGDAEKLGRSETVSNPLGWEGDRFRGCPECFSNLVSNPLGWEGDAEPAGRS